METLLILLLMPLPVFLGRAGDPSPGVFQSKEDARNLECVRLSQAEAHERFPGQVPEPPARGTWATTDVLACTRRFMRIGERPARDEAILSSLRQMVGDITQTASALEEGELTWHVDAFYPEPTVAAKISVAARTGLVERGRKVSDRVPVLAAGDLAVLWKLPPHQAYPLACERYFAQGVLTERDVFLGMMIVDPRETQLHAGLCVRGEWKWLQ
jgi:hypothetical protein